MRIWILCFAAAAAGVSWAGPESVSMDQLAEVAPGWQGRILSVVNQSYLGWDVEIGDADNDGKNEILTTGCPDSRLDLFKQSGDGWTSRTLISNLAQHVPGMGLVVKVVDINGDGVNEVILGTGQEGAGNAIFYLFQTDGEKITRQQMCRPEWNESGFTHNLATYDLDKDGVLEVVSAYCGHGEVIRYDIEKDLSGIASRKIYNLSGSGEESLIVDVDNDGAVEYVTSNGFRAGKARAEIFEFGPDGELITPPRLVLEGFDGQPCFYTSLMVGDVDNDGKNELIVGWKREQQKNLATVLGYRVGETVERAYTFDYETEDLDMAYFEKMMAVADADNDGKKDLIVSTRGDNVSEFITSRHLGHVFQYQVQADGKIKKERLLNFNEAYAESSWLAVGDADNDGRNEIVLATGKGDRTQPGVSYLVLLEKAE